MNILGRLTLGGFALGLFSPVSALAADPGPLIPRDALFGNPTKTQARLSPDGKFVSYLAPRDGVLNVWVAPFDNPGSARPITNDRKRGILQHFWAYDNAHVLYLQDEGGDENWRLHGVALASGKDTDLTPLPGVQAQVVGVSPRRPGIVLVGLNDRVPEWHDLHEIDLATGTRRLVEKNQQEFAGYVADATLVPRLALKSGADGDEILVRNEQGGWDRLLAYGPEDTQTTGPIAVEGDGRTALIRSSVGRDTAALVRVDLATRAQTPIAASERADVADVWLEPVTYRPQAYVTEYIVNSTTALDPAVQKDIDRLTQALGPQFDVVSRTLDDRKWIVVSDDALTALASWLYDRGSGAVTKLFDQRPALVGAPLAAMTPLEIKARDGLTLVSYLTLPKGSDSDGDGRPDKPLPLVLNVHGGPWSRDSFGFDAEHQWFANRGYAVLSANFRGSTGFGKKFVNAGDREWGARMHDDLLDAIDYVVRERITNADSIAIYGGSYGGYAALVGLTLTPDRFACAVDIVGPSNLETLLNSIPAYWKAFFEQLAQRVGDPRTEAGRKLLAERSPLTRVSAISKPLLIMQGANDPRVKQAESDQIVAAMKAKKLPVTYVLFPDEGHGFARPPNRTSSYAISEGFLSKCLGGRYEPVGDDFAGSSVQVIDGVQFVPGLAEALAAKK